MFYHIQILGKKGPLGTIWIAAHHDKRLKRSQVFETSLKDTCESLITPEVPLALRLSGQLLLGITRIYSKKVGYLFQDCRDSFGRMKIAMKEEKAIDLPAEAANAPEHAITMADFEEDVDFISIGSLSAPATPISGSFLDSPEMPRKLSISSELRRSLSFDSPRRSVSVDMEIDERFEEADENVFDIEPEQFRSEEPILTPQQAFEAGEDLVGEAKILKEQESPGIPLDITAQEPLEVQVPDLLATPEAGPSVPEIEADFGSKVKHERKKQKLLLDVNSRGSKQISLDHTYVRARLRNASDTLRDLEKDIAKAVLGSQQKESQPTKKGRTGTFVQPAVQGPLCEDLLELFQVRKTDASAGEDDIDDVDDNVAIESVQVDVNGHDARLEMEDVEVNLFAEDEFPSGDLPPPTPDIENITPYKGEGFYEGDENLEVDNEGWSQRTKQTLSLVQEKGNCFLEDLLPEKTRKDASRCFFELLVLNSKGLLKLSQTEPYGNIAISI